VLGIGSRRGFTWGTGANDTGILNQRTKKPSSRVNGTYFGEFGSVIQNFELKSNGGVRDAIMN